MNNIRPFRDEPTLLNKIGVSLLYLVLGWTVAVYPVTALGNLLSIFLVLGILVWAFVIRKRSIKYFVRFHVTQALLLNISIAALLWLLIAFFSLLATIPGINILVGYILAGLFEPMTLVNALEASVKDIILVAVALSMVFYSLKGRYTELPWITDGVRHWV